MRIGAIRANRFAVKPLFSSCPSDSRQTFDSLFFNPRSAIRKKGVQFRSPETIRENQAIRANLRIDSRESGHLSTRMFKRIFWTRVSFKCTNTLPTSA